MKRAWLVIGEANARKSSLIRCLTGLAGSASRVEIEAHDGSRFWLRGAISAMQEPHPLTPEAMLAWMDEKDRSLPPDSPRNWIIPLRLRGVKKCPDAEAYIDALQRTGWEIVCVACLGNEYATSRDFAPITSLGIPVVECIDSHQMATNAVAAQVRTAFGWR